jgi:hypothetical protein
MVRQRRYPLRVRAYLCLDVQAGWQRVLDAGREFFRLGLGSLSFELWEELEQALAQRAYIGGRRDRQVDGGLSAECGVQWVEGGRGRSRTFAYSPKKFETFLELLERNPTLASAGLYRWRWRSDREEVDLATPSVELAWTRFAERWGDPLPDWVILDVVSQYEHLLGSEQRQQRLVEFLERVAGAANPACGEVHYVTGSGRYSAPLEYLLQRHRDPQKRPNDPVRHSRQVVRSYSWVTVIAEEIGQRLGGLERLRDSGAFHRVVHLPGGGFLLQATARFEDYQHEQAYRVFTVLAPALPPGVPDPPEVRNSHRLDDDPDFMIVQQDPSSVLS